MTLTSLPPRPRPKRLVTVWRLVTARVLRNFTQGFLNVLVPLYLVGLGVSVQTLGLLFTVSFGIGALLMMPAGYLADRFGRKPVWLAWTGLVALWGLTFATIQDATILLAISALAGIGRGSGGQAGPQAPVEQAWIADLTSVSSRSQVLTRAAALAALGAAAGAFVSGVPTLLGGNPELGQRILFGVVAAAALFSSVLVWPLADPVRKLRRSRPAVRLLSAPTRALVWRQGLAAASNGMGSGFVNALLVVWLHRRFGVGASVIGPILAVSFLAQAAAAWFSAHVARRYGAIPTIVASRAGGALLMAAIGLAPTVGWAFVFQVARMVAVAFARPVRQTFSAGLYPSEERATANAVTGLARRLPSSASPVLAGQFLAEGLLELPFLLGAAFQLLSAWFYWRFFSTHVDSG